MQETKSNIDSRYVELVKRFKAVPHDRAHRVERIKMLLAFRHWYSMHRDQLTEDEREFLQANIVRVDRETEEAPTEKDHWDE